MGVRQERTQGWEQPQRGSSARVPPVTPPLSLFCACTHECARMIGKARQDAPVQGRGPQGRAVVKNRVGVCGGLCVWCAVCVGG